MTNDKVPKSPEASTEPTTAGLKRRDLLLSGSSLVAASALSAVGLTTPAQAQQQPVPVVNQIRTYWWCSPPRIGRQRMCPASSRAREIGASFSKDKCVRISL